MEASTTLEESSSRLLEEYTDYFASVEGEVCPEELLEDFPKKNISYDRSSTFEGARATPVNVERRGAIVHFKVDIGGFTLGMVVLNVAGRASKTCR